MPAAGDEYTVVLRDDGEAVAFGDTHNDLVRCIVPPLPEGLMYTEVAAARFGGSGHTVLVRSDGEVVAFGDNQCGQCCAPQLSKGQYYVAAAAGPCRTVLLRNDGEAFILGCPCAEEDDDRLRCSLLLPDGRCYVRVAAAHHTVLIRDDGYAIAFGCNRSGQCLVPSLPEGLRYVTAAVGAAHTILLRDDGVALAFGHNACDQCQVPALPDGRHYIAAAGGLNFTVLIRDDGEAVAFGDNNDNQCAVPSLPEGRQYKAVACGSYHTILIRDDGEAIAFGYNNDLQCNVPLLPEGHKYRSTNSPMLLIQLNFIISTTSDHAAVVCINMAGNELGKLEAVGLHTTLADLELRIALMLRVPHDRIELLLLDGRSSFRRKGLSLAKLLEMPIADNKNMQNSMT